MAAAARAAHLEVDRPPYLFEDTLARRLLGERAEELLAYHHRSGSHPVLVGTRLVVTARARYAEQHLAAALRRGITQYVVLGAGLDSYGSRSADEVTVYEVDEPDTSAWKREVLQEAGLPVPDSVRLVPADLAHASLVESLVATGFDARRPAFVSWLGVTMYLERPAIARTLEAGGRLAPGSEVVFDHALPPEERDAAGAEYASIAEAVGVANGEPWVTALTTGEARALAQAAGLAVIAQPLLEDWVDPAMWRRSDAIRPSRLWAMLHARAG